MQIEKLFAHLQALLNGASIAVSDGETHRAEADRVDLKTTKFASGDRHCGAWRGMNWLTGGVGG